MAFMAPTRTPPRQVATVDGLAAFKLSTAAKLLDCSVQHLYNEIGRGHIKTFTLGRSRRISAVELARLMGEDDATRGGDHGGPAAA